MISGCLKIYSVIMVLMMEYMVRKVISIWEIDYSMVLKVISCIVELRKISRKLIEWLVKLLMFLLMCWLGLFSLLLVFSL